MAPEPSQSLMAASPDAKQRKIFKQTGECSIILTNGGLNIYCRKVIKSDLRIFSFTNHNSQLLVVDLQYMSSFTQMNNLTVEFFLLGFQNDPHLSFFFFCLLLMVYCGTICGNLLIITLVSTSKNLHTPMYYFISQLSISDIMLTTDIAPYMFHILLNNGGSITVNGCITQFYFFCAAEAFECFLLAVMSYDRYVAICKPLHYTSIMTSDRCVVLAAMCWGLSFSITLMDCITISMLTFCGPNIIDHFFCDLTPLLENACSSTYAIELEVFIMCFPILFIPLTVIIISYVNIIVTILKFQSNISRQKAFSTCSSHLIVVSFFYFTLLSIYLFPKGEETLNFSKFLSLLYTVFTPLINPIIYSLRNKDIKKSLQEIIKKCASLSTI
ncbi:olfactory receptor 1496-like [Dendrobates tinctorius]|uniref:olfactory receptor 1496-like n=1 Tax=Dendrobates tinctorius TaxID=92724 RepID=UPI003CCA5800